MPGRGEIGKRTPVAATNAAGVRALVAPCGAFS